MVYDPDIRYPLKQNLALECGRNQNIVIITLIQKACLFSLRLLPLMAKFSVFIPLSGYSIRELLTKGLSFEVLQNYTKNKNEGNENKITIEDFNYTIDKHIV